jgi:hypothetical protein
MPRGMAPARQRGTRWLLCSFEGPWAGLSPVSGGFGEGETPLPIPNRAVKPLSADGTWPARAWESRTPPVFFRAHEPPAGGSSSICARGAHFDVCAYLGIRWMSARRATTTAEVATRAGARRAVVEREAMVSHAGSPARCRGFALRCDHSTLDCGETPSDRCGDGSRLDRGGRRR